ncbi:winged helix DNA-binding protein [Sphingobium sp. AP50]|uniref:winged helix DNA-binding protein n=1 Tax=Sphingobium sp. AP50 TaxID=1884369 RepID=UPI0015A604FE|nr:winged helix DNA-binding protein [Sphingobium sp. AP50]
MPDIVVDPVEEGAPNRSDPRYVALCLDLIANRQLVGTHIGFELSADPVWDMLLDLYIWEHRGRDIAISSLASAANVPPTTARASIRTMRDLGWVYRQRDPVDGRRIYIRLTKKAHAALEAIFEGVINRSGSAA